MREKKGNVHLTDEILNQESQMIRQLYREKFVMQSHFYISCNIEGNQSPHTLCLQSMAFQ